MDAYNPGTALLRSLDTYWSVALGGGSHAAVVLFTLFLGGLIGVVQRSGGANGLANSGAPCVRVPACVCQLWMF